MSAAAVSIYRTAGRCVDTASAQHARRRESLVATQWSGSVGRRARCGHRERRIRPTPGRRASSSHPGPAPLPRRINTLSACERRCVGGIDSTEVERGRRPGAPAARNYPRLPASNLRSRHDAAITARQYASTNEPRATAIHRGLQFALVISLRRTLTRQACQSWQEEA